MKSTSTTSKRRWTRRSPLSPVAPDGDGALTRPLESENGADTVRADGMRKPGPYETAYDISTGYALERRIVRP